MTAIGGLLVATAPGTAGASASVLAAPGGAPDWDPARTVTRVGVDWMDAPVDLAVGRGGRAAVIYSGTAGVQVRRLTATGRWTRPLVIGRGKSPRIVLDRAGNATAAWISTGFHVMTARQPAGGRWGRPRRISPPTPDPNEDVVVGIFGFDLAANPAGDVAAAWKVYSFDDDELPRPAQAAYRPAGGGWGPARTLDPDTDTGVTPQIAVRADGGVVAAYSRSDAVMTRDRVVGQGWTPPEQLAGEFGWVGDLAVGGGSSVAVWTSAQGLATRRLTAARRPAGGDWTDPVVLATTGVARSPRVWVDGTGRATAAWKQNQVVTARSAASSRNWGAPSGFGRAPALVGLAGNPRGDLLLAWRGEAAGKVRVAYRPAGRRWAPSFALGAGSQALVGVYPNGETLTVWRCGNGLVSRRGQL